MRPVGAEIINQLSIITFAFLEVIFLKVYIWDILNALKSHDECLEFELDELHTDLGRGNKLTGSETGFSKIVFDLPTTIDESFAESLRTFLVEKTTSSWSFWLGLLETFINQEDHAVVSQEYKTKDGYRLGYWVSTQRKIKDKLTLVQRPVSSFIDFISP